ncbi:MAG: YifB family Mg chelatase-like AAA ATPase [Aquificae bacterium]|nr:YifB family Mg chelatase-like AAA ATPase [Aquificota bacterium]
MLSIVKSGGTLGVDGYVVDVEVNISSGLPQFITVGLPDTAVKESRERVKSAISNIGLSFPIKKIVVNLAPADVQKQGTLYDLPVAVGILAGSNVVSSENVKKYAFIGELALDGSLRAVKGILPIILKFREEGINKVILPIENGKEAALVDGVEVYGFSSLKDIVSFLNGEIQKYPISLDKDELLSMDLDNNLDFAEVKGQHSVKRALEIAASGFHNVLMIGSPGSGKTMLARRFTSILPDMTFEEAIETTKIHSVAGILKGFIVRSRPFRSPHHTISDIALIGGGTYPKPGEVSLAHNGVLFLDELPEFKRSVLEVLRQPLEDKVVSISRASGRFEFPAKFQFIAAANPCPCGYKNDSHKECTCTPKEVKRYLGKISGPLLDRIDILTYVSSVKPQELSSMSYGESSKDIKQRVLKAVDIQRDRYKDLPINFNSEMTPSMIDRFVNLDLDAENILNMASKKYNFTARTFHRVLKVARTIADLDTSDKIKTQHIIEAINFKLSQEVFDGI